ncbi:MAG TPA: NAD(P)-dependent oxidoreductase [Casimicrobiaceae bacterium]|nr:NAD(P)-dependent oxidoreductase [Casimicrobiaceae bacterium]
MMKVGVLGASGLVGSRLVEMFHLEEVAEVIPIVRGTNSLARLARFALDWRIADAMDATALAKAFRGCEVIIHAVHGPNELIVDAPVAAYRAAREAGVRRIIYLSTTAVHGQNPGPRTDEASALHTRHPYAYNNAKVRAEREFRRLWEQRGVELVTLRPGVVFGPRDRWISNIARTIVDGTAYVLAGPGICNTVYVDNLVHAIRLSLTADVDGETFIIVDRETVTWRELYTRVASALGSNREIPEIADPAIIRERAGILDSLKEIAAIRAAVPRIPRSWKLRVRESLEGVRSAATAMREARERGSANPWRLPTLASPRVSAEAFQLSQCSHQFSYAHARDRMAYEPLYSVDEGLRRTLAWLKFVGYPVAVR